MKNVRLYTQEGRTFDVAKHFDYNVARSESVN